MLKAGDKFRILKCCWSWIFGPETGICTCIDSVLLDKDAYSLCGRREEGEDVLYVRFEATNSMTGKVEYLSCNFWPEQLQIIETKEEKK